MGGVVRAARAVIAKQYELGTEGIAQLLGVRSASRSLRGWRSATGLLLWAGVVGFGVSGVRAVSRHRPMGSRAAVSLLPVRRWIERRGVVLVAAAALFIVVFALCHTGPEVGEGIALLYVVPIALVALSSAWWRVSARPRSRSDWLAFGALDSHTELDAVGFLTRGVAYVAVGVLAGRFSDRMRDAHAREGAAAGIRFDVGAPRRQR